MKAQELREKTDQDLAASLEAAYTKLQSIRFDLAAGRVKNVKEAAAVRRTIARIKTERAMRARAQQTQ